ncbi:hypothetical protein Cva_00294 [Caedimonas varicaedens]|uniref:Addiction module killer protein n=1 Tax=Caedimonas varicaedens TaxID=1629334 RepID=A0A0K8MBR5_9PROT|nr:hypothetical protein Cva_00294 [Caedimonas varicaedens]
MLTLEIYQTENGKSPFIEWIDSFDNLEVVAKINARLLRLRLGNIGDCKSLGEGLFELRIDTGPGYRIYFLNGDTQKILLLGGIKKTQMRDIKKAKNYLSDYRSR